jgi:hypothetical protein|tara:strand:+ start:188 stop:379 length:192 start_codon:yes stop_codon:yes gene_type:complete
MSNKAKFFHNVKKAKRQRLNAVYTKSELLILTEYDKAKIKERLNVPKKKINRVKRNNNKIILK